MPQGTIKKKTDIGFGFITTERGTDFFHSTHLERANVARERPLLTVICPVDCDLSKLTELFADLSSVYSELSDGDELVIADVHLSSATEVLV